MDNVSVSSTMKENRKYTSTVFINLKCGLSVIDMHKPERQMSCLQTPGSGPAGSCKQPH